MKKINIFLIIVIFIIGAYLVYANFFKSDVPSEQVVSNPISSAAPTDSVNNSDSSQSNENAGFTQEELAQQIKDKQFLEDTYLALEYSKVNNIELRSSLEAYIDDNSQMTPDDMKTLITLHEKTFLNRYLKVFVDAPSEDLNDLNSDMRRVFYQVKSAFDVLHSFGNVTYSVPSEIAETATNATSGLTDAVSVSPTGSQEQTTKSTQPTTTTSKQQKGSDPNYDVNLLRTGLEQLKATDSLVDQALKDLGTHDVTIEQKWIEANLTEGDISNAIDSTNPTDLSQIGNGFEINHSINSIERPTNDTDVQDTNYSETTTN